MVFRILEEVLVLEEFLRHQLTVVFLEVSEHVSQSVIGGFCHAIADIPKICLLDCGGDFCTSSCLTPPTSKNRRTS